MGQETAKLLDRVANKHNVPSDNKLSKLLGVTRQAVSNWRTGVSSFDDSVAVRVAELLGENPAYILAVANAERTKNESARRAYKQIAGRFKGAACISAILAAGTLTHPSESVASTNNYVTDLQGPFIHYANCCVPSAAVAQAPVLGAACSPALRDGSTGSLV